MPRGRGRGRLVPPPRQDCVFLEFLRSDIRNYISKNSRCIGANKVLSIKLQAREHQLAQLQEENSALRATIKSESSAAPAAASITSAPVDSTSSNRALARAPTRANANRPAQVKHEPDCECVNCFIEHMISKGVPPVDSLNDALQECQQPEEDDDHHHHHGQWHR